jgi:hypothetical protein
MKIKTAQDGDYRYIWKFIWFPTHFNGYYVWLEKVYIRQIYFNKRKLHGWYNVCLSNPKNGLPLSLTDLTDNFINRITTQYQSIK